MKAVRWMNIAVFTCAAYAPMGRAAPVTLTFSHGTPTTHPEHVAAMQFAKHVEQRTNGQIKFDIFPAGQLGSENEVLEKVSLGAIDMAASRSF